jgi:deoxycytidylate deaminase
VFQKGVFVGSNSLYGRIGQVSCSSTHAEINVLMQYLRSNRIYKLTHTKISKKISKKTLIVVRNSTRINSDGTRVFNNSAPCPTCSKFLYLHGIQTVKYSDNINGENVLVSLII